MDYYGFDGYFFNQESYDCTAAEGALIDEMMRYMHKMRPDMLISWYDSMVPAGGVSYQNAVNDANKQFMTDSEDGTRAIDEFLMNYNWYENQVDTTISTMQSIGRSEFDAFAGLDVQQNCMNTPFRDHHSGGRQRHHPACPWLLYCPNSTLGLSTSLARTSMRWSRCSTPTPRATPGMILWISPPMIGLVFPGSLPTTP